MNMNIILEAGPRYVLHAQQKEICWFDNIVCHVGSLGQGLAFIHHKHILNCQSSILECYGQHTGNVNLCFRLPP